MDVSRRISKRVLGLAARLLVALMLLAGPYAQAASAGFMSDGADHHAAMSTDAHQGSGHEHSSHSEEAEAAEADDAKTAPAGIAEKCCDLFCVGVACILPSYGLESREPATVAHVIVDADVAPGEWVLPHRPPNA
jgi:hypothetical protein